MIEEGKFGTNEAIWLTTITISSKVFFTSPPMLAGIVGSASWYLTLISALFAMVGFYLLYLLLKRFPGKDLAEIYEASLGRTIGFIFTIILSLYMLFISLTRLSEFGEVIKVFVFPLTPNWIITGVYVISIYILCILGLESMARLSRLLIYSMLAGFLVVIVLGTGNYNISYLYPIGGHGLGKTIINSIMRSSIYGEVVILAIFAKSLQGVKYIKREGIVSIIFSGFLVSVSLLAFNLTFPYFIAQEITAPMYTMATLIDFGRYLQRVEPIFLFIWMLSALISATVMFYSFIWMFCKTFRIQDKRPIILGGAIILYSLALMHKSMDEIIYINVPILRDYGSLVFFIMPTISLLSSLFRKRRAKSNE